ncbi:Lar family restriction alleviation protein [Adlercreutzia sp. ZJ242]|uniref:Lar family restriction alleviation protein n=1 Tax=Adlercreutzia sp. ZJ242 TaxID=2709409 RepID=UPI0013E9C4A9
MIALESCPFCGGEARLLEAAPEDNEHLPFRHFTVYCRGCKTMIGTVMHNQTDFFDTPQEAISAWNRRAERTCRKVPGRMKYGERRPKCSECGYSLGDERWAYCPKCGSKVVEG